MTGSADSRASPNRQQRDWTFSFSSEDVFVDKDGNEVPPPPDAEERAVPEYPAPDGGGERRNTS
jgi:hypothetical protein